MKFTKSISALLMLVIPMILTSCSGGTSAYNLHKTLALVIIVGIIISFFVLALYSNMLRDEVNDCNAFNAQAAEMKRKRKLKLIKSTNPYSLSRVQLAVWTVIISCSYIYLELCKGDCDHTDINQTALILMGIGAGVTTAGTLIDKREIQDNRPRHQNMPSDGFFTDILSDDNGISIHRFQNVVWTGIAMIVYLNKIYLLQSGCSLPELSDTLLALTGISSTAYLFVKSQENNPPIESAEENSAQGGITPPPFDPAVIPPPASFAGVTPPPPAPAITPDPSVAVVAPVVDSGTSSM